MTDSYISSINISTENESYAITDKIVVHTEFSLNGELRDAFTEKNWTESYKKNDVTFKMKYGIKLSSGKLRKQNLGEIVDTYRKAAIFWTRNPNLVNPMKEKRVWVQVSKNFKPIIRLTEEGVKSELFDFKEDFEFDASVLGIGTHSTSAEVFVSWEKHDYIAKNKVSKHSDSFKITIK